MSSIDRGEAFLSCNLTADPFHVNVGTEIVAWVENSEESLECETDCRECKRRMRKYGGMHNRNGSLMFQNSDVSEDDDIRKMQVSVRGKTWTNFHLELVTQDTFPPCKYTGSGSRHTETFYHVTVIPSVVTSPALVNRMRKLWPMIECGKTRIAFMLDNAQHLPLIHEAMDSSTYGGYWKTTYEWITDVVERYGNHLVSACVYAFATGNVSGSVHTNFCTLESFVDFCKLIKEEQTHEENVAGVAAEMDRRANPRTNQIAAVSRAKAAHGVEAKRGVALQWESKDDLDIHVTVTFQDYNGKTRVEKVWYRNRIVNDTIGKKVAGLNFDAGIGGREKNPVEFVSIYRPCTVDVSVFIYTRRTPKGLPINYSIVVSDHGNDKVFDFSFDHSFENISVVSHTFAEHVKMPLDVTEKERTKMADTAASFGAYLNPTVSLATREELIDYTDARPFRGEINTVIDLAMMLDGNGNGKCEECSVVEVHAPDLMPGYVTKITAAAPIFDGNYSIYSGCCYTDAKQPPVCPRFAVAGTARLDEEWHGSSVRKKVLGITIVDKRFFLILSDVHLPKSGPFAAGMYPHQLSGQMYTDHKNRWTFLNSVKFDPKICTKGDPAIGAFLLGDTARFFIDGRERILSVV